ncbi:cell wall / vacuolar inhibitor of fructosidase 1-like, partial [Cynara cardunculus var. scolymus]|uniref:cell wall / vacuolar inhibitor of fructosidase 1-like n=1 Tax=Cynara cardunculus var. scolymus TaxID=59895 RepID=UPI000D63072F
MKFIQDTCKSTPNYDLCVKIILADPKSQDADLTDLALIIVNAVKEKVTADVPEAVTALTQGNPKFAEDGIADCAVESQACESTFGQYGQASPMTNVNKDMEYLTNVVFHNLKNGNSCLSLISYLPPFATIAQRVRHHTGRLVHCPFAMVSTPLQ